MVYLQRRHGWCHMKLLPSRRKFCVHHTTMHHVTLGKATYLRCVYLAVTYHLHFWQNDRGLLHAAAVTRRWNGYRNKSQHRKLTLEKKILPPLLQGHDDGKRQLTVEANRYRSQSTVDWPIANLRVGLYSQIVHRFRSEWNTSEKYEFCSRATVKSEICRASAK